LILASAMSTVVAALADGRSSPSARIEARFLPWVKW
jgi:hypothetical protein